MSHRSCRCAFLVSGALLVLLALVLALHVQYDATHIQPHEIQRAYVIQAVSRLESGCLTCHELVSDAPAYTLVGLFDPHPGPQLMISGEWAAISPPVRNQLHTRLIETGQRILKLPDGRDRRVGTVMENYLHVYAQAGAAPDKQTTQWALWQLDALETLLPMLENQALPYQLVRPENQLTQFHSIALHSLTVAPGVAVVAHDVSISGVVQVIGVRSESDPLTMPFEMVYATHRRGPPSSVYLDSVL